MKIKEMVEFLNTSQTDFAKRYKIPLRTVQEWIAEKRTPPPYVIDLLERAVRQDKDKEDLS